MDVINMSLGAQTKGIYSAKSKVMDFLVSKYNCSYVVSCGNLDQGEYLSNYALSYNLLPVDGYDTGKTPSQTDDLFDNSVCSYKEGNTSQRFGPEVVTPGCVA